MEQEIQETLDQLHKHSTRLKDIEISFSKSLPCGFKAIEDNQYIVQGEGNLIVIAARPGNGKTALATQIVMNVAEHSRALLFSLEMKKETLRKRMLSVTSQVPIKKMHLSVHQKALDTAKKEQEHLKLDIIDEADLTLEAILQKIFDENSREPLGLVVIDYIGLVSVDPNFRAQAIGNAVKALKQKVADVLKIPVIILSQMTRAFDDRCSQYILSKEKSKLYKGYEDTRGEIRPVNSDIAESSKIEHWADVIMFLHRPVLIDPEAPPSLFKVFVTKNRNGELKDFELEFSRELTKFYSKGEEEL